MMPQTQLVNLFSPDPKNTHSGRTTPSSVGGVASGRPSVTTISSGVAVGQSHLTPSQIQAT
jgi:hypothetical protein